MKKIIFITCLITAFFFTGINEVEAQWCVNVEYIDTECNCENITSKKLSYSIYDLVTSLFVVPITTIDLPTGDIQLEGTQTILWDAQDRYLVYVRITYYDPTVCCGGWDSDIVDGDDLTECEVNLLVIME